MAKDKKKGKLPKRVAGVKIPKHLRHRGEALLAQAQSPAGRAALVQGATVVAGIAANALQQAAQTAAARHAAAQGATGQDATGQDATGQGAAGQGAAGPDAAAAQPAPAAVADLVGAGVDALMGRLFGPRRG